MVRFWKLGVIFLLLLIAVPLVSSSFYLDTEWITAKQGTCFNIFEPCDNCTYMNITIMYPNGTAIVENEAMTNLSSSYYYNYSFCDTDVLGIYPIIINYDEREYFYSETDFFRVTYNGHSISEAQAILYTGFLALLVLIFITNFIGMSMLPARNERDEEGKLLSISYLKYFRNTLWMTGYFLFIAIVYIASNLAFAFFTEQLVAKALFMIFQVSFGLAPIMLVLWIIWVFVSIFHDKQLQSYLNRGLMGGNL